MMSSQSQGKRRILVIDDEAHNRELLSTALEGAEYLVQTAQDGTDALHKIKAWTPHLILLDIEMPGLDGISMLKQLRAQKSQDYIAVMFLSGKNRVEDIVAGLDTGADDYLVKPFRMVELLARVRAKLRIKDLHDQLARMNTRLAELVETDDLTGLYNMRSMYEKLDTELSRARRFKKVTSCAMVDLDEFKTVNDRFDHLFGSFVIAEAGGLIKSVIRTIDIAARYGGDEFLIIFPETDQGGAERAAERIRKLIETKIFSQGQYTTKVTGSFGVAVLPPEKSTSARDLVRAADHQLHLAKEQGRNRISTSVL